MNVIDVKCVLRFLICSQVHCNAHGAYVSVDKRALSMSQIKSKQKETIAMIAIENTLFGIVLATKLFVKFELTNKLLSLH